MNDQEFTERLYANPQDASPEFTAALQDNPAREAQRTQAREFDVLLRRELNAVMPPQDLRQKLLNPALFESVQDKPVLPGAANADSFIRRFLPVAACLVVALGLAFYNKSTQNAALEAEIFDHVYREAGVMNNIAVIPMDEVNARLDKVLGAKLTGSKGDNGLKFTYADDCWIARHAAIHMVMKGNNGAVSVMMIPNSPVESEFNIADERFSGLVTPTAGGNLVVIGDKGDAIVEYRNLLSRRLEWDY